MVTSDPLDWSGQTAICIASGPSLCVADMALCRGQHTIAVNTTYQRAPWAEVIYAGDACWWHEYHADVAMKCSGQRWTVALPIARAYAGMHWIEATPEMGLSREQNKLAHGGFSGYQAIGLAVWFGASRILLLGYDCQLTDGLKHWHGDHPGKLNRPVRFERWIDRLNGLAKDAAKRKIDIINCTRETALTCFQRASIQDCL